MRARNSSRPPCYNQFVSAIPSRTGGIRVDTQHIRYLCWAAAALLLIALLKLLYGYYQFLRVVVCLVGIIAAIRFYGVGQVPFAVASALAAIIFNPIAPLHFDRETWMYLNAAGAAVFAALGWGVSQSRP